MIRSSSFLLSFCLAFLFTALGAADRKDSTKPLFASKVVTAQTPGQGHEVSAEIKGIKELHLYVSDTGNGYACDWAGWVNPRLVDASGKVTKLTSMKWKYASSGWGGVNLN